MKTIDFNYFIERYISDEMMPEERSWFEKEMEGNPSLRQETELRRKTDEILCSNNDILVLRSKLAVIASQHNPADKPQPAGRMAFIRYAAAVAFLVMTAAAVYIPNRKMSNDKLFDRYAVLVPTAGESVSRSSGQEADDLYNQAMAEYREGHYTMAISLFIGYTTIREEHPELLMMLGNSYMQTEQYTEAGINYSKVVDHNNNLYLEDANWLLGLCYLKTGDNALARQQMSAIINSESRHRRDAKRILKKMK